MNCMLDNLLIVECVNNRSPIFVHFGPNCREEQVCDSEVGRFKYSLSVLEFEIP